MATSAHRRFFGSRRVDGGLSGCTVALGVSGTGKTYKTLELIARTQRCIVFDVMRNVNAAGPRKNRLAGFRTIEGWNNLVAALRENFARPFRLVYHPGLGDVRQGRRVERRAMAELVALMKLSIALRDVVLVVDEVWRFNSPGWMPSQMEDVVFTGRHWGITFLCTAQRPAKVCKDLLSGASSCYLFRMPPIDARAIQEHLGIPDAVVRDLPSLPDRWHYFRDETLNWKKFSG